MSKQGSKLLLAAKAFVPLLCCGILLHTNVALAQTTELDLKAIRDATQWYDETSRSCTGVDDSALVGGDNIEKAFNWLVSPTGGKLPDFQAAGIIGNLNQESHLDPTIVEGGGHSDTPIAGKGYGIAQWTFPARQRPLVEFAKAQGKPVGDLGVQLAFIMHEFDTTFTKARDNFKATTNVDDAAFIFHRDFEISADSRSEIQERLNDARKVLRLYGGTAPSGGSGSTTSCAGAAGAAEGFVVYNQCDRRWGDAPYGTSTVCPSGCGPSSMAMIITALTGQRVTPDVVAKYAGENGQYDRDKGGTLWTMPPLVAKHWDLKAENIGRNASKIVETIRNGGYVITSGRGAKPFTTYGHFIVIRAVTEDGKWMVGDSAHNDTNTKKYDPAFLLGIMKDGSTFAITK